MPEPKQLTLEDDELFLVSFIMLALGNGILIAIALMIWRNQALDVDNELVRWVLAAIALRIFSLQLDFAGGRFQYHPAHLCITQVGQFFIPEFLRFLVYVFSNRLPGEKRFL